MSTNRGTKGWRLYARIVRALIDQPRPTLALVDAMGLTELGLRAIVRRMHDLRLIHIQRFEPSLRSLPMPVWAFGDEPDAPMPLTRSGAPSRHPMTTAGKLRHSVEMLTFRAMLNELTDGACTAAMLASYCGTDAGWTRKFLGFMHEELKLLRIADWEQQMRGGTPSPMFAFEPGGTDKRRPARTPRAVIDKRRWDKRKRMLEQRRVLHALAANASEFNQAA